MSQASQSLRQAVFQALVCAQSAAAMHNVIVSMGGFTRDVTLKNEARKISEAAYAASAHAWMAMIAMAGNQLDVAQSAAHAAYQAEQVISQSAVILNLSYSEPHNRYAHPHALPDERGLTEMWQDLCASLPHEFPVPENLNQTI